MTRRSEPGRQGEGEDRPIDLSAPLQSIPCAPIVKLCVCLRPDDLVEAIVIEPDRHAARSKEYGHAIAYDQRPRMVHLERWPPWSFTVNMRKGWSRLRPSRVVVKFSAVMGLALVQWFRG